MREYRRQQSKKYNQQCAPLGKIREYSSTASMMILRDLEKGWSAQQIAAEYGRDVTDVQQHIEKILQDGTAEKIKKRLAAYQESNTLKRRSGLL
jgi:DNA-binding NarL/FixJ family response regulator